MSDNQYAIKLQDGNFGSAVLASKQPVLVDLWAPWCGPCRTVGPVIEELAKEFDGKVVVGKLNVDENPKTAADYHVHSIPTLLFISDGREIDRIVGAVPKHVIAERLHSLIEIEKTESNKV